MQDHFARRMQQGHGGPTQQEERFEELMAQRQEDMEDGTALPCGGRQAWVAEGVGNAVANRATEPRDATANGRQLPEATQPGAAPGEWGGHPVVGGDGWWVNR